MQHNELIYLFKKNLLSQKRKFEEYLDLLECEKETINKEEADILLDQINLENAIVKDIETFQKFIEPLEKRFYASPFKKDTEIISLKNALKNIRTKVIQKSNHNKNILLDLMIDLKSKIRSIKKQNWNIPFRSEAKPVYVDITT